MIDLFLEKIKLKKGKGINKALLINIFAYTNDYQDVKYIINKVNLYYKNLPIGICDSELMFTEDYNDARKIFAHYYNAKLNTMSQKIKQSIRYLYLIETTDTLEELAEIFEEMKSYSIHPPIGYYVELIKKQLSYKEAREIFEKYILIPERKRIENWKVIDTRDDLKKVYGILYLKAKANSDLVQIKNELRDINMSIKIEDYYYLKEKSCNIRIGELRKMYYQGYDNEVILEYIFQNEDKNNLKFSDECTNSIKVKRNLNIYQRNRNIVEYIKNIYNDKCQICGERLELMNDYYSEVHHIHSLHLNGKDIIGNMIVLCPNHHVLFDKGSINLDLERNSVRYINGKEEKIKIMKHKILSECVNFNNENIFKNNKKELIDNYNKVTFGSEVIMMVMDVKEEFVINIPEFDNEVGYFEFKLLNHKIGDSISIADRNYVITSIK